MSSSDPLLDALSRANPVPEGALDAHAVPPPGQLEEIIATSTDPTTLPRTPHRALLLAAAVVMLIALVTGAVVMTHDDGDEELVNVAIGPTSQPTTDSSASTDTTVTGDTGAISPPGAAQCVEFYSLDTLTNRQMAFDGTVRTIDGQRVTFDVSVWYAGGEGAEVTLSALGLAGPGLSSIDGGVRLTEGERFLVSGDGGNVWGCGFTQLYDATVAESWATAFGS